MGAWGAKSFENDQSRDWLAAAYEGASRDWSLVETVLDRSNSHNSSDEVRAIAAAEIVAAAIGRASPSLPREALALANQLGAPSRELIANARASLARILGESELRELWDDDPDWLAEMQELLIRLS